MHGIKKEDITGSNLIGEECSYSRWEYESGFILHGDGDLHHVVMQGGRQLFTVTVGHSKTNLYNLNVKILTFAQMQKHFKANSFKWKWCLRNFQWVKLLLRPWQEHYKRYLRGISCSYLEENMCTVCLWLLVHFVVVATWSIQFYFTKAHSKARLKLL